MHHLECQVGSPGYICVNLKLASFEKCWRCNPEEGSSATNLAWETGDGLGVLFFPIGNRFYFSSKLISSIFPILSFSGNRSPPLSTLTPSLYPPDLLLGNWWVFRKTSSTPLGHPKAPSSLPHMLFQRHLKNFPRWLFHWKFLTSCFY